MIDKTLRMALLYDAYGSLLTEKQREFVSLYYNDNLSLGEIAANYGVSRQAVYDILKRSEGTLNEFEERLSLVAREEATRAKTERIQVALAQLSDAITDAPELVRAKAAKAISTIQEMLAD